MTGSIAFGPTITQSGITPPPPYTPPITCDVYNRAGSLLLALPNSWNRSWQDQLNVEGTGAATLQTSDVMSPSVPWRSILIFSINTVPRYASIIEHMVQKLVAQGEEVDETLELSGRGTLALFEEAVTYPENWVPPNGRQPFTDTRLFSYASIDLDDSAWGSAVQIKVQNDPTPGVRYSGAPASWPDPAAWWIWGIGGPPPYPVGNCYFRKTITLAQQSTIRFYISADDGFELFVDGGLLQSDTEAFLWGVTKQVDIIMDAGSHLVAIKGTNIARPSSPGTNAAAIICSMYEVNGDGSLGGFVEHTDSSWKCLSYPPNPPGFTIGQILRILVQEAQTRGTLAGISLAFNDTNDSNGAPWTVLAEVPIQIGDDMLTTIKQLTSAYCDVAMGIGTPILFAYNSRGTTPGVTLAPAVNLGEWSQDAAV